MSIHNFANAIVTGSSGQGGGVVEQSLKFNDDESQYLSWTPAAAGNRRTWTWSAWVKRGNLSSAQYVFFAYSGNSDAGFFRIEFNSTDTIRVRGWGTTYLETSAVYRDTSAWYHIVLVADTTQSQTSSSASDSRIRLYVNGEQVTAFSSSSMPSQNTDLPINNNIVHDISGQVGYGTSAKFDGYLSDINFIDGQALDATSFGQFTDGYWEKIDYDGTYGTNGFHLTFQDDVVSEGFNTVTYAGNGSTQSISGLGFEPDFVWIKERSSTSGHALHDSVRGAGKYLGSHSTSTENTSSTQVTSFDADGFTTGASGQTNENNQTYVAWAWDAGSGSPVSNTGGSITSTLKANPDYGFSIVKWVGDGTSQGATVGHSLGVTPSMIIVKSTDSTASWNVWHKDLTNATTSRLILDDTDDEFDSVYVWGSTAPDNSAFGVGTVGTTTWTNRLNRNYIAYCFAEVAGYSSIGSYTGTGSNGNAVTCGFAPAFVMIKRKDSTGDWLLYDTTRSPYQPSDDKLRANTSGDEAVGATDKVTFTNTGFEVEGGTGINASGGTYIYMAFADTREAAFWKDVSGENSNNWTPNNLDYRDSLPDSPTNNFAVMNILDDNYASPKFTYSEGNLKYTYGYSGTGFDRVFGTIAISPDDTNKYYFEFTANVTNEQMQWGVVSTDSLAYSIADRDNGLSATANASQLRWVSYLSAPYLYRVDSSTTDEGTLLSTSNGNAANGAIYSIVYDAGVGKFYAWFNGVEFTGQNYAVGTSLWATMDTSKTYMVMMYQGDGGASTKSGNMTANFGADSSFAGAKPRQGNADANGLGDFYYTVPQDALALCTANLPTPSIVDGSEHFNTVLYTGNGGTQSITGVNFESNFTWIKRRDSTNWHMLYDSVRGAGKSLNSNETNAEFESITRFTSFDSDGFTVGNDANTNSNTRGYVSWNWKAGGTAVSNTDGSITSSVSANTTAGFSIVQFVGDANGSSTVGHGLSKTPNMVIVKPTSQADSWPVYHSSLGVNKTILLEVTNAEISSSGYWGSVTPSVFGLSAGGTNNRSGATHIAYCFADTDGYLKAGSYTGNGSTDGPFVYTGFRPSWLMIKRTDSTGGWVILDVERDTFNVMDSELNASSSAAETSPYSQRDYLSNGFKIRNTQSDHNASGGTYIYLAFAESPFKYSNAR